MVMETVFIINPKAGKRNDTDRLVGEIKKAAEQTDASVTTYITKCVGDATRFVSEFCRKCGKIRLCIDGEIVDAGKTRFKALHNAFNFVIPAKTAKRETIREYVIPCNGQHIQ